MKRNIFLMADAPAGGNGNAAPVAPAKAVEPAGGAAVVAPAAGAVTPPAEPAKPKFEDPFAAVAAPKKDEPKPGEPADKKVPVRKDAVSEQRARIEAQNKELSETKAERDALKAKFEEAQKRGGGDVEAFTKRSQELETEIKTLRGKIAERDYSEHPDFIEKFQKPFEKAAETGKKFVDSLTVTVPDGQGGSTQRKASWDKDFAPIFSLEPGAALEKLEDLFGTSKATVLFNEYKNLHALQDAKSQALADWGKNADQREQTNRAESLRRAQEATTAFNATVKDMTDAEENFRANPEDPEEVELFKKSQQVVDTAYLNRDKLTPQQQIIYDAAIYTRARALPIVQRRLASALAEVKSLEERIGGKAASRAGATRQTGAPATVTDPNEGDWKADLRKTVGAIS